MGKLRTKKKILAVEKIMEFENENITWDYSWDNTTLEEPIEEGKCQ